MDEIKARACVGGRAIVDVVGVLKRNSTRRGGDAGTREKPGTCAGAVALIRPSPQPLPRERGRRARENRCISHLVTPSPCHLVISLSPRPRVSPFSASRFPLSPSHPQLHRQSQHLRDAPCLRRASDGAVRGVAFADFVDLPDGEFIHLMQQRLQPVAALLDGL